MWQSIVIRKAEIQREIERLIDRSTPDNGQRASKIVHPLAVMPGRGLAPGTDVTIRVLMPGEETLNRRRNSNQIEITVQGEGTVTVDSEVFQVAEWDVWTIPSMRVYRHRNTGQSPWVRLTYSNAPVLEKLEVHFKEEFTGDTPPSDRNKQDLPVTKNGSTRARDLALCQRISSRGAEIRGYEWLLDVDSVESHFQHWPWEKVQTFLPAAEKLSDKYNGRRVFLLYNPATERKMGTSDSFFATISSSPPNNNYIPHRHTSSAINYYLRGKGYSKVQGQQLHWEAGDLLLSAPGWAMHSHHSTDATTSALTIQDHPFHIGLGSLVWQERMNEKLLTLGRQSGFETNLASVSNR